MVCSTLGLAKIYNTQVSSEIRILPAYKGFVVQADCTYEKVYKKCTKTHFFGFTVHQPGQSAPWLLQHDSCGQQGFKIYLPSTTIKDRHQPMNLDTTGLCSFQPLRLTLNFFK